MSESKSTDPLRIPIDEMLLQQYTDADGDGKVGKNPGPLKIHKVAPGKAKGALLFKNTTNQEEGKVYTQLHFEPFQWGYIELGDATAAEAAATTANDAAKAAATAAATAAANSADGTAPAKTAAEAAAAEAAAKAATALQDYLNLISSKPFFPFKNQAADAIKQYNESTDVAKFIRVEENGGIASGNTSTKILAHGVCASEAQLEGKAKFDFKSPPVGADGKCDTEEHKQREAERKIASHAIAMVADRESRTALNDLGIAYKDRQGKDAYIPNPTNTTMIGGEPNPLTKLFSTRYNLNKMIKASLDAYKSKRKRNKKAKTMKVFGAAKRHRKIFFK